MEVNLQKSLVINNKRKFDIYDSIKIHDDFIILIAKKRFLNLLKNVSIDDSIGMISFKAYIDCYINGTFKTLDRHHFMTTEDKVVIGILFGEVISGNELMDTLDNYRLINILSK